MADAKKPAAKKTAPKKTAQKQLALREMSVEELNKQLTQQRADLLEAKKSHRAGELVNPRVLGATRKQIARLNTAIRAAELKQPKENK